tara:strand:- start:308 stop:1075 length:768 start_codon:yes stop_codon:yes gene_type:complete
MYKNNYGGVNKGGVVLKEWALDDSFTTAFEECCGIFDVRKETVQFNSQQNEDKYIIQYILKEKITDGTFIEMGALDGIAHSNTKTLEDHFGFSGILIEPVRDNYERLVRNRPNSKCYNYAVSDSSHEYVDFMGYTGAAGIADTINHASKKELPSYEQPYKVKNKKLSEIIEESGLKYIDIFSLDVEGGELEVLKSVDYKKIDIYCIIVEAHSDEQDKNKLFTDFLHEKGFTFHERQGGNNIYINKNSERKNKFKL